MNWKAPKSPEELGIAGFERWRAGQREAVEAMVNSKLRFSMNVMPVGAGKSLAYVAALKAMIGMGMVRKAVVVTGTKSLQNQLAKEFGGSGMVDVRGQSNYQCIVERRGITVDMGSCHVGVPCAERKLGCLYYRAEREAARAEMASTNYAWWMHANETIGGGGQLTSKLGNVDALVLDEAHAAVDHLSGFMRVKVTERMAGAGGFRVPVGKMGMGQWREWASESKAAVGRKLGEMGVEVGMGGGETAAGDGRRAEVRKVNELRRLGDGLGRMACGGEEWAVERGSWGMEAEPVDVRKFREKLFGRVKRVMLVSATATMRTAEMLGIGSGEVEFREVKSTFRVESRPVTFVPTVTMRWTPDKKAMEWAEERMARRVDQIVGARGHVRGLVHTVSYARAEALKAASKMGERMVTHGPGANELGKAVERYLDMGVGAVLVSPVVTTGLDFKHSFARYQIITKIPFPNMQSEIMKARKRLNPDYPYYVAAMTLAQTYGRVMRAADDEGETFILDTMWRLCGEKLKKYLPGWMLEAVRESCVPTKPLTEVGEDGEEMMKWEAREREELRSAVREMEEVRGMGGGDGKNGAGKRWSAGDMTRAGVKVGLSPRCAVGPAAHGPKILNANGRR